MRKPLVSASLALWALALASIALAADDPWVGSWVRYGHNGAPLATLTIAPLAGGGYTLTQQDSGMPSGVSVAVVPDGRAHTVQGPIGTVTSTCRQADARTVSCSIASGMGGSTERYALSADGRSLADTSTSQAMSMEASTKVAVSAGTRVVTSVNRATSAPQTKTFVDTSTLVYQKQ